MSDVRYTWADRDLPILRAALRRLDDGEDFPRLEDIREEVGLDVAQMRAGLKALESGFYMDVAHRLAGREHVGGHVNGVSERARRELGSWPSAEGLVDRLVAALTEAEEREPDPLRRGKLRSLIDGFTGGTRDLLVDVMAAYVDRKTPG